MFLLRKLSFVLALALVASVGLSACSPEVGSEEWCQDLKKKEKGQWTANEAADFAKSCIF